MIRLRIEITFAFDGCLRVPVHHNVLLHGLIYQSIRDPEYRDQLHNSGFTYEKRQFRMFCYSRLSGHYRTKETHLEFTSPVSFIFSTHDEKLIRELTSSLFTREQILIGTHPVKLVSIRQIEQSFSSHVRIRMLTPVTAYSTFLLNNKKKTFFFSPMNEEFQHQVQDNACKKYTAIHGKPPQNTQLLLSPVNNRQLRPSTVMFKQTYIKGWMGEFELQGNPDLIRIVYDVGLSAKNTNGLGLFEIVKHVDGKEEVECSMPSQQSGS